MIYFTRTISEFKNADCLIDINQRTIFGIK
jgi:hypothetical protein